MATATPPKTLREAILFFADYANCKKAVEAIRWPNGTVACPTCGSEHVTYLEKQRRYKCYAKHAKAQFSLKVGTMGLLDRHGKDGVSQVRMTVLKGRKSGTLQGEVRKHVAEGSNIYTDAFYSYRGLQGDFQHGFVDHAEAYVDGQIHTNSCE